MPKQLNLISKLSFTFIVLSFFSACKKDNIKEKPAEPEVIVKHCRISTINTSGTNIKLTYNSEGKPIVIENGRLVTKITYSKDSILTISKLDDLVYDSKEVFILNSNNLVTKLEEYVGNSNTPFRTFVYEYEGTQLIQLTDMIPARDTTVTKYLWENGNMVSSKSKDEWRSYTYFDDVPYQNLDFYFPTNIIRPFEIIRTKNMLKSSKNELNLAYVVYYKYNFDSEKNITLMNQTNGGFIHNYEYQYDCK